MLKTNKTLTLSIVIPVYNEQGYLKACLDSIAAQTDEPDEVIVVDNNSTDGTAAIAKSYAFVKLLREPKQGVVFARNRGFNEAKSQLIGRIDGDTTLPANWVAEVKRVYSEAARPVFYAATAPSKFRSRFWSSTLQVLHLLTYFWPSRLLLGHNTLVGSNMFITRQLWLAVRAETCSRTDIHEDMDLAWHVYRAGAKINFLKSFKASIVARKMTSRIVSYPMMMLKIKSVNHKLAALAK